MNHTNAMLLLYYAFVMIAAFTYMIYIIINYYKPKNILHKHDWEYYNAYREIGYHLVPFACRRCKCGKDQRLRVGSGKFLDGWYDKI